MSNKRELTGLSSNLGGYWGQEDEEVKKAPKKNNSSKKTATEKATTTSKKSALPPYVITEKTHSEADFYGGNNTVRVFVPQTELGDKVDKFLYWTCAEEEENNQCMYANGHKKELETVIDNAGYDEIAPFYEPLNQSYMQSLSFFAPTAGYGGMGSTFATMMAPGLKNKKGSAIEQMKAFAKWYASIPIDPNVGYGGRIKRLDWLIKKFEAKKPNN